MQNDERLVAFIRQGNSDAFDTLFKRYQARLLAFCRHMVGSQEDAEDVLQEVFAAAHNAMCADERKLNVRPWLYRIARNRCLNHLRKPQPAGQESMDDHAYSNGASTAEQVEQRAEFRHLISDVGDLPETQRTALLLREIDNLSYEDISVTMDTTVPSVKSLLVRARISLAEAAQARELTCDEVRVELGKVAEGLQKTSAPVRRHVRQCEQCRRFKATLQRTNRAMAAIYPIGPLMFIKKFVVAKLLLGGGGSAAGGAAAGSATVGGATAGGAAAGGAASGGGLVTAGIGAVATKAAASVAAAAVVATAAVNVDREPIKEKVDRATQSQIAAAPASKSKSTAPSAPANSSSTADTHASTTNEPEVTAASETETEPAPTPVAEPEPVEPEPVPPPETSPPEPPPPPPSEPAPTTPAPATPVPVETPVSEDEGSVSLPDANEPAEGDDTELPSDRVDVSEPPGEPADGEAVPTPVAGEPDLDAKPKAHARRTHTKRFRLRH